jgi:hypothetical protein
MNATTSWLNGDILEVGRAVVYIVTFTEPKNIRHARPSLHRLLLLSEGRKFERVRRIR